MLMETESEVDLDDIWMLPEPACEECNAENALPEGYRMEEAAKNWYDTDVLIFVGHDEVEKLLKKCG